MAGQQAYVFDNAYIDGHDFLFAVPDEKKRPSARQIQLRRLYDVLHLCLHRNDLARARRAWSILARCKETNWKSMWRLGITLLDTHPRKIDYLRTMLLQLPAERERILAELVHHCILADRQRDALDELQFYLPSFPYRDNPVLHVYAGLLCISIAQPARPAGVFYDSKLLSRAEMFLERAKALDHENIVAREFLDKIHALSQGPSSNPSASLDSEDETRSPSQSKRRRHI